jgi:putative intracellular protease/amidase
VLLPYVPDTTEGVTEPDMVEASQYYRLADRWKLDSQPNRFLASSNDKLIAFDAFNGIGTLLTQPLLLIAGSDAGSKWHSDRAFAEAVNASEKEFIVVPGGTHMSLYDRDVGKAMPKLATFFGKHLGQAAN